MARPRTLPPHEEVERLKAEHDWSDREVAEHLGTTPQAISQSRKRWEEAQQKTATGAPVKAAQFPWSIDQRHLNGGLYRMMLAYRSWEAGQRIGPAEYRQAMTVKQTADELGFAVTYDRDTGFAWVPRRDEDGDSMFVVR